MITTILNSIFKYIHNSINYVDNTSNTITSNIHDQDTIDIVKCMQFHKLQEFRVNRDNFVIILNTIYDRHSYTDVHNQDSLFIFCYYPQLVRDSDWIEIVGIIKNNLPGHVFDINGYSPFGALIVSKHNLYTKQKYLTYLSNYNLKPTLKDSLLISVILYDCIPHALEQNLIIFLHDIDILNIDIRKYIIIMWLNHYKRMFCPIL